MPRLILLNNQPSGWASLATGAAEGLGQGMLQQEQQRRQLEARRQIMADQLGGQIQMQGLRDQSEMGRESRMNAAQLQRMQIQNDLIRQREGENYQRTRADRLGDEQTAQQRDLQQGQEYLRASGMGQPGEDYYLNPNSQPVVPQLGTRAAESLVTQKRMGEQAAAAQAERAIDNARQDKALGIAQQRADNAATQRGGQLSPDQMLSVAQDLADEYGIGLDEAIRKVRLRGSKMLAESQVKPDDTGQKMSAGAAQKEVERLESTLDSFTGSHSSSAMAAYAKDNGLASADQSRGHLLKRIEAANKKAEAARQAIGATGKVAKPAPTWTYPPNLTPDQKDEYDRLRTENVDLIGP
mgnify:FL=1